MFLLLFSLFLYEEEPEPVKKSTWSRSRSKVDRLRNTGNTFMKIIIGSFYLYKNTFSGRNYDRMSRPRRVPPPPPPGFGDEEYYKLYGKPEEYQKYRYLYRGTG